MDVTGTRRGGKPTRLMILGTMRGVLVPELRGAKAANVAGTLTDIACMSNTFGTFAELIEFTTKWSMKLTPIVAMMRLCGFDLTDEEHAALSGMTTVSTVDELYAHIGDSKLEHPDLGARGTITACDVLAFSKRRGELHSEVRGGMITSFIHHDGHVIEFTQLRELLEWADTPEGFSALTAEWLIDSWIGENTFAES